MACESKGSAINAAANEKRMAIRKNWYLRARGEHTRRRGEEEEDLPSKNRTGIKRDKVRISRKVPKELEETSS